MDAIDECIALRSIELRRMYTAQTAYISIVRAILQLEKLFRNRICFRQILARVKIDKTCQN